MKRTILPICLTLGLLLLAAVMAVVPIHLYVLPALGAEVRAADEKALREQVAAALPLGSTVEQVEAWASRESTYHGRITDLKGHFHGIGAEKPYSNWVTRWMGASAEVRMEFHFDKDGKLSRRDLSIFVASL